MNVRKEGIDCKSMFECKVEVGNRVIAPFDKSKKGIVGTVICINEVKDCDGYSGNGKKIIWNRFYCKVRFDDLSFGEYKDCYLKVVERK